MGEQARLVELPDGTEVWARLTPVTTAADRSAGRHREHRDDPGHGGHGGADGYDSDDGYDDYEDVGALDRTAARVHRLRDLITGVAASVRDAAAQAAPDEVSVEFGVEFAVRGGAVVSVLADAESTTVLKVTLTWRDRFGRSAPLPRAPAPPAAPPMPASPPQATVPPPSPSDRQAPGGGDG